jgi:hypothetical protein
MVSKLNSCIKYANNDKILDPSKASKNLKIGIFPEEVSQSNLKFLLFMIELIF